MFDQREGKRVMKIERLKRMWKYWGGAILELTVSLLLGIGFPIWDMADKPGFYPDEGERILIKIIGFAAVAAIFNLFRMPAVFKRARAKLELDENGIVTKGVICAVEKIERRNDQPRFQVVLKADGKYFPVRTEGDYGQDAIGRLVPLRYSRRDSDIFEADLSKMEWAPEDIQSQPPAKSSDGAVVWPWDESGVKRKAAGDIPCHPEAKVPTEPPRAATEDQAAEMPSERKKEEKGL